MNDFFVVVVPHRFIFGLLLNFDSMVNLKTTSENVKMGVCNITQ